MADEKNKPAKQAEKKEVAREEFNLSGAAHEIIDQALQGVSDKDNSLQKTDLGAETDMKGAVDSFKGLPMSELIGGPLMAAAEAQRNLAGVAWDFYQKIAYNSKEDGTPDPASTRLLTFQLNRLVEVDGEMKPVKQSVEAPFIGLVPIPSLLIDRVDVDFQMEVTDTNTETAKSGAEATAEISGRKFGITAKISGKVSSSRENTRSTNQTAKYQVHVSASQQPQTEGLSKLMDIMASCIEPMTVE